MKRVKIELFCSAYIKNGFNGAAAYRSVNPTASDTTASVEACRYLANPSVQHTLRSMVDDLLRTEQIDRNWVLQRLIEQANGSPLDYFNVTEDGRLGDLVLSDLSPAQWRNLKSIKVTRTRRGQSITVTVHDQQRSVGIIAKMIGLIGKYRSSDSKSQVGEIIERGVRAIRKHRNLDAWREVVGEDQAQ